MNRLGPFSYGGRALSLALTGWAAGMCLAPLLLNAQTAPPLTINPQQLPPQLRAFLQALGDRLTIPGKERAVMVGSVTRYITGSAPTYSVRMTTQLQGKVRIDNLTAGTSIGSDGAHLWASSGSLSSEDAGLLEVALNDNMEHFLDSRASGSGGRFLGSRFRFDEGSAPNYTGPYYDVYTLSASVFTQGAPVGRWGVYCINSDLGLLERVQYSPSSNGGTVPSETVLTGWQVFQGQEFPTKIQQLTANGTVLLSIQFTSISVGALAADGLFQP